MAKSTLQNHHLASEGGEFSALNANITGRRRSERSGERGARYTKFGAHVRYRLSDLIDRERGRFNDSAVAVALVTNTDGAEPAVQWYVLGMHTRPCTAAMTGNGTTSRRTAQLVKIGRRWPG